MGNTGGRRGFLQALGFAVAGAGIAGGAQGETSGGLLPAGSGSLKHLMDELSAAPRRREFVSVPMILTKPQEWDAEALALVLSSQAQQRQVWNNFDIGGYWLTVMRNALNTQIWGFDHPDFVVVSATHGSAGIALYDQWIWDKYDIPKLLKGKFATNTFIVEKGTGTVRDFEDPSGVYSSSEDSIPTLMRRGVIFMACHNAIWAHAEALIRHEQNPDRLDTGRLAAELSNHLVPGTILTPGVVGTLPELQKAGFHYAAI